MSGNAFPYWRFSNFYLFYFAVLGALIPYWGLYLKSLGYDSAAIGELMAILVGTKVVAPFIWGWMADHWGRGMVIVRVASLLAALCFGGIFLATGYWQLALVMASFSFFWNAALPQFEANTLNQLGRDTHRYTHVRVWGSVGFVAAVLALGPLLDRVGVGLMPKVVMVLLAGIWLAAMVSPEHRRDGHEPEHDGLGRVLRQPRVIALLVACFLIQGSHGPYYSFYSIHLEDLGYSRAAIGQLWALGVVAEVVLFVFMHRILHRHSLRALFLLTFALTTLRWLMIGLLAAYWPALVAAQLLHAASFGLYHAVGIQLIHRYFVGRNQGRGQALYSSVSFGAGGAVGSFLAGHSWDTLGPAITYLGAAAACLAGLAVVWGWVGRGGGTENRER